MQLGMIGLGRMGANMVRRLMRAGEECVVWDVSADAIQELSDEGATGAESLEAMVAAMAAPRHVWIMVPAAHVDSTIERIAPLLEKGDTIIDGGNSHYHHDIRRANELAEQGLSYVDAGVSGGVWGLERGYCIMAGGDATVVNRLAPVFEALCPGHEAAGRTPGREGEVAPEERGWLHCGPVGAGHFVKMVHNGIEYGAMAAYAEGLNLLRHANIGRTDREADAETTPLEHPEHFQFDLDIGKITEVWRRGSVVESWLLDLTAAQLHADPQLEGFSGHVSDSGEGRWTVEAAIQAGVPAHVLSASLFDRFNSRSNGEYSNKVLSAMRKAFGGHIEKK